MSALAIFSFENSQVRTLGTAETPLFVAIDICTALGLSNARKAVADHVDTEDIIKAEIETKGGRQTVNCVNESGLYALIFGSKVQGTSTKHEKQAWRKMLFNKICTTFRETIQQPVRIQIAKRDA